MRPRILSTDDCSSTIDLLHELGATMICNVPCTSYCHIQTILCPEGHTASPGNCDLGGLTFQVFSIIDTTSRNVDILLLCLASYLNIAHTTNVDSQLIRGDTENPSQI